MILFSNAKINIGLNIIAKCPNGFHNIETVFYPVKFSDIIEIKKSNKFEIVNTGIIVNEKQDNNLCAKAYYLIKQKYDIPPVKIHLHKLVPFGAGLGGGSSNASFVLKALNKLFKLKIIEKELTQMATQIGSDCAFFIKNKVSFASGKGDIIENIDLNLSAYYIAIIYPNIHINTAKAYKEIAPKLPPVSLMQIAAQPIDVWKHNIVNDFEFSVFKQYSKIKHIKEKLYLNGAVYASMSGSGSAVYGIFKDKPNLGFFFSEYSYWDGRLL